MAGNDSTLIALNPVRADRADEFETFLRSVVAPATHAQRPDLEGQWRVLRADEPDDDGIAQDADRAMKEFVDLLAEDQSGWFFTPVSLDRP